MGEKKKKAHFQTDYDSRMRIHHHMYLLLLLIVIE